MISDQVHSPSLLVVSVVWWEEKEERGGQDGGWWMGWDDGMGRLWFRSHRQPPTELQATVQSVLHCSLLGYGSSSSSSGGGVSP
jgi:hypothetical protein